MNILKTLRKPYFACLLASLMLFVSCSQYDSYTIENGFDEKPTAQLKKGEIINGLDEETIAQLREATIEFIDNAKNNPKSLNSNIEEDYNGMEDTIINEALSTYVDDNLQLYKKNVINFYEWNSEQLIAIEAIFVVLETIKDNYTEEEAAIFNQAMSIESSSEGEAWWAPLALWGVCTVVGVLTVGIAGVACAGLVAARLSYINYQNEQQ